MTTFALDYDHATALAKDLERAAIDVREPAAPPVDLSLPAHAAGHQEFLSAMQRASSVTAMQSRQLAQRLSAAADSGFCDGPRCFLGRKCHESWDPFACRRRADG
ncbi:hypothetical protein NLL32_07060 [Corynebacterium propinquum]|uniref:hypothetical protein n=1 Tax=Corynebacterium propinquum TaxID=43769 RepID=UPI00266F0B52|nr:hypothetical protein [Corynebacterium propinquum]WKS48515.1 hypothetical protein NLL32_07060 [Corynebacterium propinquum]